MGMDTSLPMKTHLLRSVLALIALSLSGGLHAAASSGSVSMTAPAGEIALDTVKAPKNVNGDIVTAGSSRIAVSMRLGKPDWVLQDGTWLYQGYNARRTSADQDPSRETNRSGTLIVRFAGHKVVSLSVGDDTTVATLRGKPIYPNGRTLLASDHR